MGATGDSIAPDCLSIALVGSGVALAARAPRRAQARSCSVSYAQHLADAPVHVLQVASKVSPFLWRCRFDVDSFERVVFIHFRLLAELYVSSLRCLQRCCLHPLSRFHTIIIPSFRCSLTPEAEQIGRVNRRPASPLSVGRRIPDSESAVLTTGPHSGVNRRTIGLAPQGICRRAEGCRQRDAQPGPSRRGWTVPL